MSDFDKEAEREKLREKYEQEEERRKTTEQMSELLLKGATMTNAHCSDCGDPIFRYDGQEFCPTCQKPVDRGAGGEAGSEGAADASAEEETDADERPTQNGDARPDNIEVTKPSDDASVQFGSGESSEATESATEQSATDQSAADQAREAIADQSADESGRSTDQGRGAGENVEQIPSAAPSNSSTGGQSPAQPGSQSVDAGAAESAGQRSSESVGRHLGQAQVVLAQTVERHARLAAAAETPRQTREHLETAREAAETLDATGY